MPGQNLLKQVQRTIQEHQLVDAGETVVVGVSGGPDSICLLHLLLRIRATGQLRIHVAHLHHGLRGEEADADADFVRATSAGWGVDCTVERADVRSFAREQRIAIEEAARRMRYDFLSGTADRVGAAVIAVGHNADDQTETILMHWLRGSGLAGLRGMRPKMPLSEYRLSIEERSDAQPSCMLIRPLLDITRSEIEAYCQREGLHVRFDRSNLDTTLHRNWLRHEVLPLLALRNPNVREGLRRSARIFEGDHALLRSLLEAEWPLLLQEESASRIVFDLQRWRELPVSLQRSTLREAVHRLRHSLRDISFVHVENAVAVASEGATGGQATLPRGLALTVGYSTLTIADAGSSEPSPDQPLLPEGVSEVLVAVPGETLLAGSDWLLRSHRVRVAELPSDWQRNQNPWRAYLDASAVGPWLRLRTRRDGDRFQPLGMAGRTVKLGDFYTNQKVPRTQRDQVPLLVVSWGIAWVCGQRLDQRAALHAGSRESLVLQFLKR